MLTIAVFALVLTRLRRANETVSMLNKAFLIVKDVQVFIRGQFASIVCQSMTGSPPYQLKYRIVQLFLHDFMI